MSTNNIYKSLWDAGIYLVLYIIIPVTQYYLYITNQSAESFTCAILLSVSILYDCYTRFDAQKKVAKRKILAIGVACFITLCIMIVLHMLAKEGINFNGRFYFFLAPLIVPVCVNIWDLTGQIIILGSV